MLRIVNPADVADFATEVLKNPCSSVKRAMFVRILAVALYNVAQRRTTMRIDGQLSIDITEWLLG